MPDSDPVVTFRFIAKAEEIIILKSVPKVPDDLDHGMIKDLQL